MMDSFFAKGFKASKCKTLLKLTIPRIKLLRNRREIQIKQMRRDIAKLLESGQEATARIRVEHIIREEKMMAAQEILELFCELIAVRLPIIEVQRDCPLDLKEAISSVCFAAPRCADLPELLQVQMSFASKYSKEFVAAATELMPDCGVNRQLIELLSIRAPSPETKLKLLKDIAEEHGLEWDPTASEAELLKSHEDLLNGPSLFGSGSKMPIPKEKHEESFHSESNRTLNELPDSETSLQMLDFHDVPKEAVWTNLNNAPVPEAVPFMPTSAGCKVNDESLRHSPSLGHDISEKNVETHAEHMEVRPGNIVDCIDEETNASDASKEGKQFVPFIAPPPDSPGSFSALLGAPQSTEDSPGSFSTLLGAPQSTEDSPESFSAGLAAPQSSFSRTKSDATSVDLQDVLTAAQAAAETAERAAVAARSAASLAQMRISELTKKKSIAGAESGYDNPLHVDTQDRSCDSSNMDGVDHGIPSDYPVKDVTAVDTGLARGYDNPFHVDDEDHSADGRNVEGEDYKIPSDYCDKVVIPTDTGIVLEESGSLSNGPFRAPKFDGDLPDSSPHNPSYSLAYQRSTSIEDESCFAYPNLFSSQNSFKSSTAQPSTENVRSSHEP